MFVHTDCAYRGIIIPVKTPQYIIYIILLLPHSKIPSPKRGSPSGCLFTIYNDAHVTHSLAIVLQGTPVGA